MQTPASSSIKKPILPSFARFLLDRHMEEFCKVALKTTFETDAPILKLFKSLGETELLALTIKGWTETLGALTTGKSEELMRASLDRWKNNQLPGMEKDDVVTEDITLLTHVRKKTLTQFIPRFTKEPEKIIKLIEEIDGWQLEYTSNSFKIFIQILQERIESQIQKLKNSDALFRQAQAITHIGNYVWDLSNQKLTWSEELYRIYGLDPTTATITNEIAAAINHPDDLKAIYSHIQKSRETLQPFDFFYRIIVKGKTKTLHARGEVVADEMGKPAKILGTAQDVTSQKDTERKFEENRIFINKIADAAPAIIASYNIQTGNFVYVSNGLRELLGYDPESAREQGMAFFTSLVHPDDLPSIMQRNSEAQQQANENGHAPSEAVVEFIYRMRHANGTYRWFHTYGTVFSRDKLAQVELVLNISLDITEKIKAEEIIMRRTAELQQSNANLQEFAFVASHDLKEPLRKISTLGDRLLQTERENYSSSGKVYLDKMITGALRMQQMVDDLLSLSQISNVDHFEKTNLDHLLAEVLQTFESQVESMGATIQADQLPVASVVPSQFRQLFQNLISNSLKFYRPGVSPVIRIKADHPSQKEVQSLALRDAPSYLRIEFSDNGIGFDNKFAEKIFAIFQRLHTKTEYEGTGIGLAICRKIIENHGGVMQASGSSGEGAVFKIIIPLPESASNLHIDTLSVH
jgi:PAS domain S-box-containing protein